MILSDRDLRNELGWRRLVVEPLGERAVQPASVDLRLGGEIQVRRCRDWEPRKLSAPYVMAPHEFVLGTTREWVAVPPDLCAFIQGRSSVGRGGLFVENAGLVDPGFAGELTLELMNALGEPVELVAGMPIGQLVVWRMSSTPSDPYGSPNLGSRYQGQRGPTPPRSAP